MDMFLIVLDEFLALFEIGQYFVVDLLVLEFLLVEELFFHGKFLVFMSQVFSRPGQCHLAFHHFGSNCLFLTHQLFLDLYLPFTHLGLVLEQSLALVG